jgi:ribosomal protein S18 acetylase RimI-like enzyme
VRSVDLRVRPYRPDDRAAVRRVAFLTGYMGEPIDWQWRHAESFCDLITTWYTDREPESLFVAEGRGQVVGYLTGCVESRRARGWTAAQAARWLRRGALLRPGVAGFLWRSILDLARDRGRLPEETLGDPRWPAHLHINLLPEARGRGAGAALMRTWLARLRELGVPGVHLGSFAENHPAHGFFQSQGFAFHGEPQRVPGFRTREGARMHSQWMVQSLD